MTSHAAARGENALRHFHAVNVLRRGFGTHQDHGNLFAVSRDFNGFIGSKNNLSDGSARRSRKTFGEDFDLRAFLVETRYQEVVQLVRLDAEDCLFLLDQPFFHHLQCHANRSQAGALAIAGLQHIQLAILDSEFEVLQILVMILEPRRDFAQLLVNVGHGLLEFEDRNRSTDARDHVFALGIHQVFAVELLGAVGRIAGETHARAAGIAQVAVDHGLHVDGSAEHVVDIVNSAIVLGAIVQPGAEHGVARHDQLLVRILRKVLLGVLPDDLLVLLDDFLQSFRVKLGVELDLPRVDEPAEHELLSPEVFRAVSNINIQTRFLLLDQRLELEKNN